MSWHSIHWQAGDIIKLALRASIMIGSEQAVIQRGGVRKVEWTPGNSLAPSRRNGCVVSLQRNDGLWGPPHATRSQPAVDFYYYCSNRVFGLGLCGLGWLQLSFWGWLQPLFCLVAESGSFQFLVWFEDCKGLEPTRHLFG